MSIASETPDTSSPSTTPTITGPLPGQPEEISLCPEGQLEGFGLAMTQSLIMIPEDIDLYRPRLNGYWAWDFGDEALSYISLFPDDNELSRISSISPNGNWLLFQRWHADDGQRSLWVSSLDGSNQWQVGQFGRYTVSRWLSDQEIVIVGPSEGWPDSESPRASDLFPRMVINPFLMEIIDLPLIPATPAEGILDRIPLFFFNDGEGLFSLEILYDGTSYGYYLYDYSLGDYYPIFHWLNAVSFLDTYIELMSDRTFTVVVMKPGGMDISSRLSMNDIFSDLAYDEVMQFIPTPDLVGEVRLWGMSSDGSLIALRSATAFYILNSNSMTFIDYCLDIENSAALEFSPDGLYVALTYQDDPGPSSESAWIVVLDLETGYRMQIDDYQVVGWSSGE